MATRRRSVIRGMAGAAVGSASIVLNEAAAQPLDPPYPSRPVRVVIGFPGGGGVDAVGRATCARLAGRLGQPMVVENRPGNVGNLALDHIAKSAADGYTTFFGTAGNYATQALFPAVTFDTLRDFAYIAQVSALPLFLAVRPDSTARTLSDLLALARARPGEVTMASSGSGGAPHFALEVLKKQVGVDILHVPYRGGPPALQDVLGGRVNAIIDTYGLLKGPHEAGLVRLLAITAKRRHPAVPEVPTVDEAGVTGFEFVSWTAMSAPAATSAAALRRLEQAIGWVMDKSDLAAALLALGNFPQYEPGAAVRELVARERETYRRIVRDVGIVAD